MKNTIYTLALLVCFSSFGQEKNNSNYKITENEYKNYILKNDYTYFPNRSILDSVNKLGDRKYELVYIDRGKGS